MGWFGSGATAVAGAFGGGGKKPVLAPTPSLLGTPTPPNAAMSRANATAEAMAAAKKQKKKAGGPGQIISSLRTPGAVAPPAMLAARTLLGF